MWTQVVGKVRMTKSPPVNHSWHVALYVTSRGLSTSPVPNGEGTFEIERSDTTLDAEGCPTQTLSVTASLELQTFDSAGDLLRGVDFDVAESRGLELHIDLLTSFLPERPVWSG